MNAKTAYLLVAAAVTLPVVFAYLGVTSAARLAIARTRGDLGSFWSKNKRYLLLVGSANIIFPALFFDGWLIEPQRVELVHQTVTVQAKVPVPPLRIAHLSDLHIHEFGEREKKALSFVEKAKPDLICLTGDYTSSKEPAAISGVHRFLGELEAPYGVYASLGNWDSNARQFFTNSNVVLLADRFIDIEVRGVRIRLAGVRFGLPPSTIEEPAADALNILLLHDPDYLEEASALGYDLYLSGHTHGGQIRIPGLGALIKMSKRGYDAGLFREGNTTMYVSRGLGSEAGPLPEVRLFCPPEVTVIEVRGAGRQE
jgi:predicted MPP superfamily phosphohydrolase